MSASKAHMQTSEVVVFMAMDKDDVQNPVSSYLQNDSRS
jgi:hypothetical protein